ncbi:protein ecdysoneless homolog [Poecilia formosa]|uniref:protein ecdysoneless homolog n=1 Tax=Poecilia formosa TaxID=48698 RepID=UPI0004438F95|nr:PREDICTED: protein ecdysoneless homolog [Poecilia formosa]XP_016523499.1 PREDICTED: protein ecdysoneless homolog [Poecilia formosa]
MDVLQMRSIPEDMVQYKLFLVQTNGMSSQQTEERLKHLTEEMLAKVAQLLVQYIWQDQPFNLKYHPEKGDVPAHIGGSTRYGDNIEDEWFIVYLLLHLTELFPELAARVEDNDGDFLLIEAADHLPKWLNPDTSENRVFIYRGELHILPCPSKSSSIGFSLDVVPSLAQALVLLSAHPEVCLASPKIRSALKKRLQGYPEKIKANLHRAHCFIPAGVASVLAQRPDLVAPAVSAFYLRDPVDLQACRSFKTFPPDTRVLASVTFTRCLYAQLQQQQFTPDRRSDFDLPPRSHPRYKAHELGTKLAHGFEILCSKSRLPSSEANTPVSCNPQWKNFLESLKKNGYFRGQLEGSAFHKELLRCAEIFFKQSVASKSSSISAGEEILQLLHNSPLNLEEFKKLESQLPPEDSDSWLEVTSQDLEQLLQERSSRVADVGSEGFSSAKQKRPVEEASGKEEEEDTKEEEAGYSLVAVSQGMKDFLNAMSSHEGAETPWSLQIQPFSFDPGSMANALDKLLGGKEEELDSDDLDDDYDDDDEEEEEEEEVANETEEGSSGPAEMSAAETLDSLKSYMDQMDQELQSTNVGKSFSQTNYKACVNNDSSRSPTGDGLLTEEAEEEIQPLDIDVNLVANLLESLSSQAGLAGPASNLLQSLGIQIPPNSDPS